MNRRVAGLAFAALAACSNETVERCSIPGSGPGIDPSGTLCDQLSSYRMFDDIAQQTPAEGVVPFTLNTPLFADYTTKDRFVWLPPDTAMTWSDRDALDLPVGAVLVKTFGYLHDRRDPALGRRLLETRLLIHGDDGWTGAAYVYDDDRATDARLEVAGAVVDASWLHDDGGERTNAYVVPNKNQCKTCHAEHDDAFKPLGPKARHLNHAGQLEALVASGALVGAPPPASWPRAAIADDPSSGTLDERARAWLDISCGHCHNPTGMARTSGLYLDIAQTEPTGLGVCKPPVAAGGGSGGRLYDLVPGQPDASILVFRIESTAPEIKMPELGRNLVHDEGVALIREWVTAMTGTCGS